MKALIRIYLKKIDENCILLLRITCRILSILCKMQASSVVSRLLLSNCKLGSFHLRTTLLHESLILRCAQVATSFKIVYTYYIFTEHNEMVACLLNITSLLLKLHITFLLILILSFTSIQNWMTYLRC